MNKFIFDVDGTLTPSRGKIDKEFAAWFEHFATHNACYFVTGSDKMKTVEQIGLSIYNLAIRVYNCNGNDVWEQNINVRQNKWILEETPHTFLAQCLTESEFSLRTGQHFEHRPGMVNFSVVGRGADKEQRARYVEYDNKKAERLKIAHSFNVMFPELEAKVGGETGIDISPKGFDKSQILTDFDLNKDTIIFFGDAMHIGGNDEPLATANKNGINYHVQDWKDTWRKLDENFSNRP